MRKTPEERTARKQNYVFLSKTKAPGCSLDGKLAVAFAAWIQPIFITFHYFISLWYWDLLQESANAGKLLSSQYWSANWLQTNTLSAEANQRLPDFKTPESIQKIPKGQNVSANKVWM